MDTDELKQQALAEFISTFALIFIGAGSVIVAANGLAGSNLVGVALAHGIVLAVMVAVTAHISGGHVNPAVTIGVWVTGRMKTPRAITYIVAQLAGGVVGALALKAVVPHQLADKASLGTPLVAHTLGVSSGAAVALEAILTFFLVFTVFATGVDERGPFKALSGFPIGLVLVFDILAGGPLTGAAMNPARAFGPALVSGTWTDQWVYWVGPIVGGVLGAGTYALAFLKRVETA